LVGQKALIDELDHAFVARLGPNGSVMSASDVHKFTTGCSIPRASRKS
jgi:hypothetical protein